MNSLTSPYKLHRFPSEIIQYAVWLYHRFNMGHWDIEDLLAERSITVSYESIRLWCKNLDPAMPSSCGEDTEVIGIHFSIIGVTIIGVRVS